MFSVSARSVIAGNIVTFVTDQKCSLFSVSARSVIAGNIVTVVTDQNSSLLSVSVGSLIAGNIVTVVTDQNSSFSVSNGSLKSYCWEYSYCCYRSEFRFVFCFCWNSYCWEYSYCSATDQKCS